MSRWRYHELMDRAPEFVGPSRREDIRQARIQSEQVSPSLHAVPTPSSISDTICTSHTD
jgi:hypothetical protein